MIAALPMYDWPSARAANDTYWQATARHLAEAGVKAPTTLTRDLEIREIWRHPGLLIGQTCGMPYVSGHCGDAVLVGRPDYGLEGARDGTYRSVIVARAGTAGDLLAMEGARVAVNEWPSFSGHIALRAHLADLRGPIDTPFFGEAVMSAGHLFSARMVAAGEADAAALDWVGWEMLHLLEPETAAALRMIGQTDPAPALPFITAPVHGARRGALLDALDAAAREVPPKTGIPRRVMPASDADYRATRAAAARAAGELFAPDAPPVPDRAQI